MTSKVIEIFYTPFQARKSARPYQVKNAPLCNKIKNNVRVALNEKTAMALGKRSISHRVFEDYVDDSTFEDLDKNAMSLARTWYKKKGLQRLMICEGYNLGELIQWEISYYFSLILETIEIMRSIIKKEKLTKDDQIVMYDDWNGDIQYLISKDYEDIPVRAAKVVGERAGISVNVVRIKRDAEVEPKTPHILDLKNVSMKVIARILNKLNIFRKDTKGKILFTQGWDRGKSIIEYLPDTHFVFFGEDYGLSKQLLMNDFPKIFRHNLSFKSLNDYPLNENQKLIINNSVKAMHEGWRDFKKSRENQFEVYKGTDLWPLIEPKLDFLFSVFFPKTIKRLERTESMLKSEGIDLIVLSTDVVYRLKTIVTVGKSLGIKSLVLQHGLLDHPIESLPLTADKIAVWGEYTKNWFLKNHINEDRITITGCPQFDKYTEKKKVRLEIQRRFNVDPNKKTVVLLMQHSNPTLHFANLHLREEEFDRFCKMVIEVVEEMPKVQLLVKLHPGDMNADLHKKMIEDISSKPTAIVQRADLYEILSVSDLAITYTSTAGLEAMILGKPVITTAFEGKATRSPFVNPIIPVARTKEDFRQGMTKLLENGQIRREYEEYRKKIVYSFSFKQDGKASERAANLIKEMTEQ